MPLPIHGTSLKYVTGWHILCMQVLQKSTKIDENGGRVNGNDFHHLGHVAPSSVIFDYPSTQHHRHDNGGTCNTSANNSGG